MGFVQRVTFLNRAVLTSAEPEALQQKTGYRQQNLTQGNYYAQEMKKRPTTRLIVRQIELKP